MEPPDEKIAQLQAVLELTQHRAEEHSSRQQQKIEVLEAQLITAKAELEAWRSIENLNHHQDDRGRADCYSATVRVGGFRRYAAFGRTRLECVANARLGETGIQTLGRR